MIPFPKVKMCIQPLKSKHNCPFFFLRHAHKNGCCSSSSSSSSDGSQVLNQTLKIKILKYDYFLKWK